MREEWRMEVKVWELRKGKVKECSKGNEEVKKIERYRVKSVGAKKEVREK